MLLMPKGTIVDEKKAVISHNCWKHGSITMTESSPQKFFQVFQEVITKSSKSKVHSCDCEGMCYYHFTINGCPKNNAQTVY